MQEKKIERLLADFFIATLIVFTFLALGCDDLVEKGDNIPDLDAGDGEPWEYPYFLIMGGGLSETLSILEVKGKESYELTNDIQLTGSAINYTIVYQNELFAVCSLSNSVIVYDNDTLSILREVSVGAGNNPMELVFYEDKKAYISNFFTNSVSLYDLAKNEAEPLVTIDMPSGSELPKDSNAQLDDIWSRPGGMAILGNDVFCALSNLNSTFQAAGSGVVAVIDTSKNILKKQIILNGRNTVSLLANEEDGILYAISAGDHSEGNGYVGNGKIELIQGSDLSIIDSVDVDGAPFEMVISDNGIGYLGNGKEGTILSLDTTSMEILGSIDVIDSSSESGLSYISALAMDGHGYLYVTEFNQDTLLIIDTNDNNRIVKRFTVNDGPDTLSFIH